MSPAGPSPRQRGAAVPAPHPCPPCSRAGWQHQTEEKGQDGRAADLRVHMPFLFACSVCDDFRMQPVGGLGGALSPGTIRADAVPEGLGALPLPWVWGGLIRTQRCGGPTRPRVRTRPALALWPAHGAGSWQNAGDSRPARTLWFGSWGSGHILGRSGAGGPQSLQSMLVLHVRSCSKAGSFLMLCRLLAYGKMPNCLPSFSQTACGCSARRGGRRQGRPEVSGLGR